MPNPNPLPLLTLMHKARRAVLAAAWLLPCLVQAQAQAQAQAQGQGQGQGQRLSLQFLGVSTVHVTDGQTALMTDGFFSRPAWWRMLTQVAPDEARINQGLKQAGVSRLAAVLVAHAHHDHAMDVGPVALRTGAQVVGTPSVGQIARGAGVPERQIRAVQGGEVLRWGQMEVQVFRSPHSPEPLFEGNIEAPLHTPTTLNHYREGGNLSYLIRHPAGRVLVHGSANVTPGLYAGHRADVVLLSVGLLGKQSDAFVRTYWREVVQATGARVVVPIHWDDFTRPLSEPLRQLPWPLDNVPAALKAIETLATADGVKVQHLGAFGRLSLPRVPPKPPSLGDRTR